MPSLDEILAYLGIDYADAQVKANLNRLLNTAKAWLKGAIGENFDDTDARVKELALVVISDLYDNQGMAERVSTNTRRLIDDMILQLQMELRRGGEQNG